jgi:hypothetical protein
MKTADFGEPVPMVNGFFQGYSGKGKRVLMNRNNDTDKHPDQIDWEIIAQFKPGLPPFG